MSAEIKTLREKINEIDQKSNERDKKLDRIIFLLDNDEGTGSKGLVARVKDLHETQIQHKAILDTHINTYDTEKKVQSAKAVKYGSIAGTVVASIMTAILKFFTGNTH